MDVIVITNWPWSAWSARQNTGRTALASPGRLFDVTPWLCLVCRISSSWQQEKIGFPVFVDECWLVKWSAGCEAVNVLCLFTSQKGLHSFCYVEPLILHFDVNRHQRRSNCPHHWRTLGPTHAHTCHIPVSLAHTWHVPVIFLLFWHIPDTYLTFSCFSCTYLTLRHLKISILHYMSKFQSVPNDFKFGVDLVHRIIRPTVKKSA